MEKIKYLAKNVNWNFNSNNKELFVISAVEFFEYVQNVGAHFLIKFQESGELQSIGKAFSYFARFLESDNHNVNSIAAENAYYCLAKSIILGNYFAAPELYNLVESKPHLLLDKFVAARINVLKKHNPYLPIGRMYGFNPYQNPEAKEDARTIIPFIRYYIIAEFYDIKLNQTRMPQDLIEYSQRELDNDLHEIFQNPNIDSFLRTGKEYFETVYAEIEDTLYKF